MKAFIDFKIDQGLGLSSANTYISELGKMSDNLNQLQHNETNRESITNFRNKLKEAHGTLQGPNIDRTNNNTQAILNEMRSTPYSLSSELQAKAGLRADDALNVDKLTINKDNTINVIGSKNGLNYTTSIQSQELINKLHEAKENGYKVSYSEYREVLKEAVENTNQDFKGTHSLRYDYANNQHEENIRNGKSESESISEISLNMGHSRAEITKHYLRP